MFIYGLHKCCRTKHIIFENQIKYEFDWYAIRLSRLYRYTETAAQVFHLTHADANINKD